MPAVIGTRFSSGFLRDDVYEEAECASGFGGDVGAREEQSRFVLFPALFTDASSRRMRAHILIISRQQDDILLSRHIAIYIISSLSEAAVRSLKRVCRQGVSSPKFLQHDRRLTAASTASASFSLPPRRDEGDAQ